MVSTRSGLRQMIRQRLAVAGTLIALAAVGGHGDAFAPAAVASIAGAPKVLVQTASRARRAEKKPSVEDRRKGDASDKKPRELTFDDIKFEMERNAEYESKLLTEEIEKLDAKRIKIRGYMLPSYQQDGITQFVLVRDNMECCFGPGAMLYDCLIVDMNEDKTASFTTRPVTVEGVFTIEELRDEDDFVLAIYHLQAVEVK